MKTATVAMIVGGVLVTASLRAEDAILEDVLVLGSRLEESLPQVLSEYGNRLEVITAEQIQAGGFTDVSQALQMIVPGLYVAGKNGAFDYVEVSLQGSRTSDILWLIDGVRISNRLYNGTTPLDTIPVHMIERIEVLKGGQALFYGTQAVAGAVNVVTKGFSEEVDFGAGLGFNTNGGSHYDGYFRNTFASGTSLVAYASLDKAEGFLPYRSQDIQPSVTQRERGYDVRNVGAKLGQTMGPVAATLQYQYTDARLDFAKAFGTRERFNDRNEHIVSGKVDYTVTDNFSVFLKAHYHEWTTHYTDIDNDPVTFALIVNYDEAFWGYKDRGVNLLSQYTIMPGLDVLAGLDQQKFEGSDEVLLIAKKNERVNAYFAQVRIGPELLPRTHIGVGGRYNDPKDGEEKAIWNVSAQVDVLDSLYVRAQGGTAFRLPDAYELYAIDPFDIFGNPNLKPESSTNYEAA
ncbi:MAG TPA: TonB-dependent receptor, partial [Steroidobacteraceae bacterium]|nr:TonB-dependent receptor [Steroidobacteraceae bacterium]